MARKIIEPNISYDEERRRYYLTVDLGKDDAGHRRRQCRTFSTLAAARAARRSSLIGQERAKAAPARGYTLEEWLNCWMDTIVCPNRAETTAYAYRKMIENHVVPQLGDILLGQLSPWDIQQYYIRLQRQSGLSSNTARRHHDMLSAALRAAVREELLYASPMERVEPPRVIPREASFYDLQELRRLYRLIEGQPLELPVKLAGSFGLRREEVCGLCWDCVDFHRRLIFIRQARTACGAVIVEKETKTRASVRALYMPDDIYDLLREERGRQNALWSQEETEDHVVLDRRGRPYSPNALSLAFTRFIRKNALPRITLHGLRHSFATIACHQGASLFDIGKALGHSTPSTTGRIYTHLVDRTHENTVLRVSDALKQTGEKFLETPCF